MSGEADSGDTGAPALAPVRTAIEISIRLGAIALLVGGCLMIVAPFLGLVVWALIIAIAVDEPFEWLCTRLGGRRVLAAILGVGGLLAMLFVPTVFLSETLVSGAQDIAERLRDGSIHLPPPEPSIQEIPIVGARIHEAWLAASENLGEAVARLAPQLQTVSRWLLRAAGNVGAGVLELIGSLLIAGVMLVRSETRRDAIARFGLRMAGEVRGPALVELADATVRSVVQGILGVALIQALLAAAGFVAAGIPAAGLWALLVLVSAIVQLPVFLVMLPPVVIGFSTLSAAGAIALLIWCGLVGLVDNVLKPILFGRGADVPSLVIFLGAIGGMLSMGIIGLFLGAAVLALGFELFMAWLDDTDAAEEAV